MKKVVLRPFPFLVWYSDFFTHSLFLLFSSTTTVLCYTVGKGATALSTTTLSIMTLSIMTLSIMGLFATLRIKDTQHK
jgi:hypothetical protein